MFGYVKPVQSELLVKEYDFYRATYCGICRSMKKHTGFFSNLSLNYDGVILALARMLYIPDNEISAKMKRCVAHPLKKRCMLTVNPATEYTARAFAILAYYKLKDDISDEGAAKKLFTLPVRPILSSGAKKAKIPDVAEIIKNKLSEITRLERENSPSVDEPAHLFGELLGEVFAHGIEHKTAPALKEFGYHLGRFIYAADAAEDYERDRKEGKYNPYVLLYEKKPLSPENKQSIKCALILECKKMEAAVNLLPFGNRYTIENIIKNVIYLGLPKRIGFLDKSEDHEKEKTETGGPEQK